MPSSPTTGSPAASWTCFPRCAITMRLNALQALRLLSRTANPADGRSSLLILTDTGAALVDEVIPAQLAFEDALLAEAPAWAVEALVDPLRALTSVWEQGRGN
ncbi:MarR family winged helix-turn-helix transcriptional regulator [Arthrobacter bambusae]|uniref:MarR family winged helix-turn-helix transcriptional regulator n=1 Tax=Arthrobacter bambusae TaxID=1338426 RepID=UPI0027854B0B|nr:MarR family winged helix-turn-helix transcriptional regulator [Arthrobacter bambusae]MDQ0029801.1 DNA-binding MarR family transcriptional regulator [Arthrobacter bambusae]MDQ0097681.1 DNA-binding MarR family transcriptional regulator [Arthrobacter bambusae]